MTESKQAEQVLFPFGTDAGDCGPDPALMGIKGANLVEMARIGLPVPPGFIVSTKLGQQIAQGTDALPEDIRAATREKIGDIESNLGRGFGSTEKPLLLSVRSGAAVSMPGMMDTVLNLGLNTQTVEALASETGDERFAWDSYRRFIQSFSLVVLDLDGDEFEDILDDMRARENVDTDAELPAETLREIASIFLEIVHEEAGEAFPQDVFDQLDLALLAVFNSWNTSRAKRYRDMHKISHDGGTAAVIQAMVFGNRDERSCTRCLFHT